MSSVFGFRSDTATNTDLAHPLAAILKPCSLDSYQPTLFAMSTVATEPRITVFISKATPDDDEFVLWLAPRLEAAGYTVYADIVRLVVEVPDTIRYFTPRGAIDHAQFGKSVNKFKYHGQVNERGFYSFASILDTNEELAHVASFDVGHEIDTLSFVKDGLPDRGIKPREASNWVQSIFRKAWEAWAIEKGLLRVEYSKDPAFHVTQEQAKRGQRFRWGTQGESHSSMLRNAAKNHVWSFGVTGIPAFWPYYHLKLKSRVLFSKMEDDKEGDVIKDKAVQHRLRRTVCKGWRNKQWHGRLRAMLELLAGESAFIDLAVGSDERIRLDAVPIFFTSPVTTELPDEADDSAEEVDDSTMTGPPSDEEEPE
jgi:hypothetical protein